MVMEVPLSISNQGYQNNRQITRLGNRTNTAISAYVYSQGGQSSSRKYFDHD